MFTTRTTAHRVVRTLSCSALLLQIQRETRREPLHRIKPLKIVHRIVLSDRRVRCDSDSFSRFLALYKCVYVCTVLSVKQLHAKDEVGLLLYQYQRDGLLTCRVHGDLRYTQTFSCRVGTMNDDVAIQLREGGACDGDCLTDSHRAAVLST